MAEDTLIKFARIHVKHNTKYKDAAERILLDASTNSLFTADVGYHLKQCYQMFRSNHFASLETAPIHLQFTDDLLVSVVDSFQNLCDLVRVHVIHKREILFDRFAFCI